jgi:predicted amidophosphoribosyltransferase
VNLLAAVADAALSLVLPHRCAGCDRPGDVCCPACFEWLPWLEGGCPGCADPLCAGAHAGGACPSPAAPAGAAAALAYRDHAALLVTRCKFEGERAAAVVLAAAVLRACPPPPVGVLLVPVPTTRARRRRRGYNQAALIAHALATGWGIPAAEALVRTDGAREQVGAGRSARARQAGSARFTWRPGATAQPPRHVLLVDDVLTTGATLRACASAVRRAVPTAGVAAVAACRA